MQVDWLACTKGMCGSEAGVAWGSATPVFLVFLGGAARRQFFSVFGWRSASSAAIRHCSQRGFEPLRLGAGAPASFARPLPNISFRGLDARLTFPDHGASAYVPNFQLSDNNAGRDQSLPKGALGVSAANKSLSLRTLPLTTISSGLWRESHSKVLIPLDRGEGGGGYPLFCADEPQADRRRNLQSLPGP